MVAPFWLLLCLYVVFYAFACLFQPERLTPRVAGATLLIRGSTTLGQLGIMLQRFFFGTAALAKLALASLQMG